MSIIRHTGPYVDMVEARCQGCGKWMFVPETEKGPWTCSGECKTIYQDLRTSFEEHRTAGQDYRNVMTAAAKDGKQRLLLMTGNLPINEEGLLEEARMMDDGGTFHEDRLPHVYD